MEKSIVLSVVDIGNTEDLSFVKRAAQLYQELVSKGAAIGWIDPPSIEEVTCLLRELTIASDEGNACLIAAWVDSDLAGIGWWRRYIRPTHRPHADIEKVAIDPRYQGHGLGRRLMNHLIPLLSMLGLRC
ncbi:GNAT family N-acetyltransferase [Paenibacillus sp. FJAT-27812]|uniref:GNAT family N-acetyltransferase n=1 Tax=Paenibacillus sp. FJAT-27812 TaxID=1684143 RepID=UPI000A46316F|nr:GNAT family N-acetyltransferase [Paenibacillus sp. FJAT-27812]